jgi:hypothetical protein
MAGLIGVWRGMIVGDQRDLIKRRWLGYSHAGTVPVFRLSYREFCI